MEIKSLKDIHFDTLHSAWQDAFSDYERSWTKTELEKMLYRRGYNAALSFGAFDGEKLTSFTLNGIGQYNSLKTAYDTGTGTIKEYRGKGLSTQIFQHSMPYLKQAGISQYLLEVLQHNAPAVTIYKNIGFSISREFNYFIQNTGEINITAKELTPPYNLQEISNPDWEQIAKMWDFTPSWQNNPEAVLKNPADFKTMGAFNGRDLIGYGIIEPATGDIAQLAISKAHRRKGIGSAILRELLKHNNHSALKIINTDAAHTGFTDFLAKNTIPKSGMQYEMVMSIN